MAQNTLKIFLQNLDVFGQPVSLNISKTDRYTTALGGSISLVIIGITILFFQSNVIQFLQKVNINSDTSTVYSNDPDLITLDDTTMMFAVSITQDHFNTNPFMNITLSQRYYSRSQNGAITRVGQLIDLVPCTIDRFQKVFDIQGINFTTQYNQLGFDNWLCIAKGAKLSLQGLYTSKQFDFVKIAVTACSNDTQNNQNLTWKPICQSKEAIQLYLNQSGSFQIQYYSTNYILNANEPKNYLQMYLNDEIFSTFVPQRMVKYTDIYFKRYNIATDQSLSPNTDIQSSSVVIKDINDFRETVELGNAADTEFAGLYLRRSQFTVNVTRSFQKIDNLLSYLGGFVQFMITIFGFCVAFYNKQWLLVELTNKLYNFKLDNVNSNNLYNEENNKNSIAQQNNQYSMKINESDRDPVDNLLSNRAGHNEKIAINQEMLQIKPSNLFSKPVTASLVGQIQEKSSLNNLDSFRGARSKLVKNTFISTQELYAIKQGYKTRKEYLQHQFRQIITHKSPIVLSIRYVVSQFFCGKIFSDMKCKLLEKAVYILFDQQQRDRISHDLDVFVILDKVNEIDKLKHLLLQKNQTILFNFTPKPYISLKEEKKLPSRIATELYNPKNQSLTAKSKSLYDNSQKQDKQPNTHYNYSTDIKAYYQLQKAYERILKQIELGELTLDQIRINQELINSLGEEIKNIFDVSQIIDFNVEIPIQVQDNKKQKNLKKNAMIPVTPSELPMEIEVEDDKDTFIDAIESNERDTPQDTKIERRIVFKNRTNLTLQ